MGRHIIERFGREYDFYFVPESVLIRRGDLLCSLLRGVDIVHCLNESSVPMVAKSGVVLPPIITWIHHITRWSEDHQLAADVSKALITCTEEWKREVAGYAVQTRVEVVRHGVDAEFFRAVPCDRRSWGIEKNAFVLGFLGTKGSDRDQGRKGTDTLHAVINNLATHLPRLHVLLCGPGWDSEVQDLRARGVRVTSTGHLRRSELPSIYALMDVYLMTSRIEGGPCTVLEAMACERVVVATKVGLVPSVVQNEITGYFADPGDAQGLTAAVLKAACSTNCIAMQKAARQRVVNMKWGTMLTPLGNLYEQILASSPREGMRRELLPCPDRLSPIASAADVLMEIRAKWHQGRGTFLDRVRSSREIASGYSWRDLFNGYRMIKGQNPWEA